MLEYTATDVFADFDENEVLIIAFGELQEGEIVNSFQIQDMLEYDEPDEKQGMGVYYIMLEDSQDYIGTYGGIHQITLSASNIEIALDEVGQEALGVSQIKIAYTIDKKAYTNLQEKLKRVFANKGGLKIE